jgi:hypothetical protein
MKTNDFYYLVVLKRPIYRILLTLFSIISSMKRYGHGGVACHTKIKTKYYF